MNANEITIQAEVSAPVEKVWEYWISPEHITNWNKASDDWHSPAAENDLRDGGIFLIRMEARDGSAGFDFKGKYTKVNPLSEIAYEIEDGRKVRVLFDEKGSHTRVTEIFEPENENSLELQRAGWQSILDNFKQYTERQA